MTGERYQRPRGVIREIGKITFSYDPVNMKICQVDVEGWSVDLFGIVPEKYIRHDGTPELFGYTLGELAAIINGTIVN